ncbi:MAG: hypothetical protein ACOY33_02665 [Pseudomonadota bacterium]
MRVAGGRRLALFLAGVLCAGTLHAGTVEQDTRRHLDRLRGIAANADAADSTARRDDAWQYFNAGGQPVLAVLRRELGRELQKRQPNALLLLDAGYFLQLQEIPGDRALTRRALLAIDPAAPPVAANPQQLFDYAHALAAVPDPALLPFFDRAFLKPATVVPALPDAALACAFLYGRQGAAGERHLRELLLREPALAPRILAVLAWTGTPASVPAVQQALAGGNDPERFVQAVSFFLRSGGPDGRAALLAIDPATLDSVSRDFLLAQRPGIEALSFTALRAGFLAGDRLPETAAVLDAETPAAELVATLERRRGELFAWASESNVREIGLTNRLLNTLRYRER